MDEYRRAIVVKRIGYKEKESDILNHFSKYGLVIPDPMGNLFRNQRRLCWKASMA